MSILLTVNRRVAYACALCQHDCLNVKRLFLTWPDLLFNKDIQLSLCMAILSAKTFPSCQGLSAYLTAVNLTLVRPVSESQLHFSQPSEQPGAEITIYSDSALNPDSVLIS